MSLIHAVLVVFILTVNGLIFPGFLSVGPESVRAAV